MTYQETKMKNLLKYLIKSSVADLKHGYNAYMLGNIEVAEISFSDCDFRNRLLELFLGNNKNELLEKEFMNQTEISKCTNSDMEFYANHFNFAKIAECCGIMEKIALDSIDKIFEQ